MTAQCAEFQRSAALAPQTMHASIAQNFVAVSAPMRGTGLRMARTKNGSVREHDGRGGERTFTVRNGNYDLGRLHKKLHVAQAYGLSGLEHGFLDRFVVDECAVRRGAVADHYGIGGEDDFAMRRRDGGMLDGKIALRIAPKMIDAEVEFQNLGFAIRIFFEETGHGVFIPSCANV